MAVTYKINGHEVSAEEFDREAKVGSHKKYHPKRVKVLAEGVSGAAARTFEMSSPWTSQSIACDPSQVTEFNEAIKKAGIRGAEYTPTGELQCTSRSARKAELNRRGAYDKDGGYGD